MLNYAVNQGCLLTNPFSRTENLISNASERAREKVLSYEEEMRLLAACSGERIHLKRILICALDTAMRPDEIFKLIWRDVDLKKGVILIQVENTKLESERIVIRFISSINRGSSLRGSMNGSTGARPR